MVFCGNDLVDVSFVFWYIGFSDDDGVIKVIWI